MRTFVIATRQWNPVPTASGVIESIRGQMVLLRPGHGGRFKVGMEVRARPRVSGVLRSGTTVLIGAAGDEVMLDEPSAICGLCHGDTLFEWVVREVTVGLESGDNEALSREIVEQSLDMLRFQGGQSDAEIAEGLGLLVGAGRANRRWFVEVGRANDYRNRVRVESD